MHTNTQTYQKSVVCLCKVVGAPVRVSKYAYLDVVHLQRNRNNEHQVHGAYTVGLQGISDRSSSDHASSLWPSFPKSNRKKLTFSTEARTVRFNSQWMVGPLI